MTIREGVPGNGERFDICLIGSGAAGLAVALACGVAGCSVVVLEAGKDADDRSTRDSVRILDPIVHASLDVSTRERFGGTTSAWGGLCVPYDPIDFDGHDRTHRDGWPIAYAEMAKWHAEAARFLDCGAGFEDDTPPFPIAPTLDTRQFGRLARRAMLGHVYRDAVARSSRVTLCLSTPVARLVCDADGMRVVGVDVASPEGPDGETRRITACHTVIAAGGLRTTRLLLALARQWPRHFAGGKAPLGRYYMGHLTGEVATLVFRDSRSADAFLYRQDAGARWTQRRMKIAPSVRSSRSLLGSAFTLRTPSPIDHRHGDGALSTIALLASTPLLSRCLASERWRGNAGRLTAGERRHHLRNIARRPAATLGNLGAMLARSRVQNLPVLVRNACGRYALRYHAEQAPNHDSRVFIDANDPSSLVIDFRYHEHDFDSIVRSHHLLDEGLRAAGVGHLEYDVAADALHDAVHAQSRDGYHQIGTTRMSHAPEDGIVDPNCRVHGLPGLYVASASVFPTSGSANPTFAVVAMALRLADHLCRLIATEGGVAGLAVFDPRV